MADDPLPSFDATDTTAENNARRDLERDARNDADVIRAILHTKKGRAWMLRQLERCHVNSPNKFVHGDQHATAHNLGRESYGLELLKDVMAASVDLYMTAIAEVTAEEQRKNEVRRSEAKARDEADRPLTAEDMVGHLPPPKGHPGYVPPPDLTRKK
jgi:hypothetical protein